MTSIADGTREVKAAEKRNFGILTRARCVVVAALFPLLILFTLLRGNSLPNLREFFSALALIFGWPLVAVLFWTAAFAPSRRFLDEVAIQALDSVSTALQVWSRSTVYKVR